MQLNKSPSKPVQRGQVLRQKQKGLGFGIGFCGVGPYSVDDGSFHINDVVHCAWRTWSLVVVLKFQETLRFGSMLLEWIVHSFIHCGRIANRAGRFFFAIDSWVWSISSLFLCVCVCVVTQGFIRAASSFSSFFFLSLSFWLYDVDETRRSSDVKQSVPDKKKTR